jgi:hypothetical protein
VSLCCFANYFVASHKHIFKNWILTFRSMITIWTTISHFNARWRAILKCRTGFLIRTNTKFPSVIDALVDGAIIWTFPCVTRIKFYPINIHAEFFYATTATLIFADFPIDSINLAREVALNCCRYYLRVINTLINYARIDDG